jgi:hypothetical protein
MPGRRPRWTLPTVYCAQAGALTDCVPRPKWLIRQLTGDSRASCSRVRTEHAIRRPASRSASHLAVELVTAMGLVDETAFDG